MKRRKRNMEGKNITFKTVGWPTGSHLHGIREPAIKGNWTILTDICPICGDISPNITYQGEGKPKLLGVFSSVEDTHSSKYHGKMPNTEKPAPEEISKQIERKYFL